jgi:hypothetical protein
MMLLRTMAGVLLVLQLLALAAPLAIVTVRAVIHAQVRTMVLHSVPVTDRVTYVCTQERYHAIVRDDGKEIDVDGVMHDVIRTRTNAGTVEIDCVRDDAETALSQIISGARRNAAASDQRLTTLFALLLRPGVPPAAWTIPAPTFRQDVSERIRTSEGMPHQYTPPVACPPPDRSV